MQLTHLLCNKLVVIRSSQWKSDVHITLSAFELLSSLAQLSMDHLGEECLMYVVVEFYPFFKVLFPLEFLFGYGNVQCTLSDNDFETKQK